MEKIITKAEATEQGLRHYYTGQPCKHGHKAKRFTANGICTDCGRTHAKQSKRQNSLKTKLKDQALDLIAVGKDKQALSTLEPDTLSKALDIILASVLPESQAIIEKVIEQAKAGCKKSQEMILKRVWPEVRGNNPTSGMGNNVNVSISIVDRDSIHPDVERVKEVNTVTSVVAEVPSRFEDIQDNEDES